MEANKLSRIILTVLAIAFALPLFYVLFIISMVFFSTFYFSQKFTPEAWINDEENRYKLCDDLIQRKLLIGKSKKEVLNLLGPADTTGNGMTYYIGYEPGIINIDPSVLEIEFKDYKAVRVSKRRT